MVRLSEGTIRRWGKSFWLDKWTIGSFLPCLVLPGLRVVGDIVLDQRRDFAAYRDYL